MARKGLGDLTDPIITLNDPNGVTNIGGAKEYAAKFATIVGVGVSTFEIKHRKTTHVLPKPLTRRRTFMLADAIP